MNSEHKTQKAPAGEDKLKKAAEPEKTDEKEAPETEVKAESDAGETMTAEEKTDTAGEETAGAASGDTAEEEKKETEETAGTRARLELEKKDAEIADLTDRYKRTLAEYDNYRRRTDKEKADIYSFAVRDVMAKILPVLDNLQRGIAAIPEESKEDSFAQGMDKIEKQFEKALEDIGIKPIEAVGSPFDPKLHNAVMHVDDPNLGENVVAQEFQKGYTYKEGVIRTSMVQVAN